jgi:hypothetical protein
MAPEPAPLIPHHHLEQQEMTAIETTTTGAVPSKATDLEEQREQRAAEAYERIRSGQHFRDWRFVAEGLAVGRTKAMRTSYSNQAMGSRYNKAFGEWMNARPWAKAIDKATRNHLLWLADHLAEVEAWRETLAEDQRQKLNHPSVVKRNFEQAHRIEEQRKAGEPAAVSPMAALKAELIKEQEQSAMWKRRAERGGSLFDIHNDSVRSIAITFSGELETRPGRAEAIAREVLKVEKEKKSRRKGHAG